MLRVLSASVIAFCLLAIASCKDSSDYPGLSSVPDFGSNPGSLDMFMFAPTSPTADMPLVVALHGCSQSAADMADLTRWNDLGERHGFYVIYPEQRTLNNVSLCFNWFQTGDIERNEGESRSIRSMVQHMLLNYPIDPQRVYVTGLSAGGAMTTVMLACYPEMFAAGAVHAGGPYKAATDMWQSISALAGNVSKSGDEWGNLVRGQNLDFTGSYPRVSVFHGTSDNVVNPNNAAETVKQWANVHGTDAVADVATNGFQGAADVQQAIYLDADGNEVVVRYTINDMGHAIAVNSGACRNQGGSTSTYATEKGFFSTYWSARFFGLVPDLRVAGPDTVAAGQTGLVYSVPHTDGSTYVWQLPVGCTVTEGAGSGSITVSWGQVPGAVACTETDTIGCSYPMESLSVSF
ncbi:MAG: PHB depolymerase family esterase [Flavobacteriales bacterium]|nr:PHB depolymerase family esterase [Flavobacteriales bacterium]